MMGGYFGGFGMFFGWIIGIIVLILLIRFFVSNQEGMGVCCTKHNKGHNKENSAGDELKHRYAKGEITKKEYETIKKDIEK